MDNITLDQTVPISSLPRDYMSLLQKSAEKNEPVVLLKHNKSVGAIISDKLLRSYSKLKTKYEEEKLLRIAAEARAEYATGKMPNSNNADLAKLIGYED